MTRGTEQNDGESRLARSFERFDDLADETPFDFSSFLGAHAQDAPTLRDFFKLRLHAQFGDTGRKGLNRDEILVPEAGHFERSGIRDLALRDIDGFLLSLDADLQLIAVPCQRLFHDCGDGVQWAGNCIELRTLFIDLEILSHLRRRGPLDFRSHAFGLSELGIKLVSQVLGFHLGGIGRFLGIAEFLIEEIDLLLHHFVPILQRAQQGFLFGHLFLQGFILGFEWRVVWCTAIRRAVQNDEGKPGSGVDGHRDWLGRVSVPHNDMGHYPCFMRTCP